MFHEAPAEIIYGGALYKSRLKYARLHSPDDILVLSTKYFIVPLSYIIKYYDESLTDKTPAERVWWANEVVARFYGVFSNTVQITILAGNHYRLPLENSFMEWGMTLINPVPPGLGYFQQLAWLKKECKILSGDKELPYG